MTPEVRSALVVCLRRHGVVDVDAGVEDIAAAIEGADCCVTPLIPTDAMDRAARHYFSIGTTPSTIYRLMIKARPQ